MIINHFVFLFPALVIQSAVWVALALMAHGSVVEKRVMEASFPSQAGALKQSAALSHWHAVMKWPLGRLTSAHDGWDGAVCLAGAPVPCQPCDTPLPRCFLVTSPSLFFTLWSISKGFIHTTGQINANDLSCYFSCSRAAFGMHVWALCHGGLKWRNHL